ncbi:MAG: DUF4974 domain-containing protein [Bacteroidaceae bacterium]|nr:DUF4974 domain-containing protein [Bacteroidaceae bacterium]
MRTDDKLERLLDMTEHPERYSVEELTEMLDDPEAQEWTNWMVEMKQTQTPSVLRTSPPLWGDHSGCSARTNNPHGLLPIEGEMSGGQRGSAWVHFAAAIAALFILSGVAYAAWHFTHSAATPPQPSTPQQEMVASQPTHPDSLSSVVLFDKVPLDSILSEVSDHYRKSVAFRSEALCSLRFHVEWDRADSLEAFTDLLNEFDGVCLRIENDTIVVEQE